jgi:glycosyltransferase involved in cell wall biosynthesis
MDKNPLVSIIIPTLNSEKTLEPCLESIANQSYHNYEIIIVDGGSEDKTLEIAEKFKANVINVDVKNMSKQTNIGISNSNGDYVYRVDSDVILNPKILEESIKKCEDVGYDGVCIHWIPDESMGFWSRVRKIEKENYVKYLNYVGSVKYNKNVNGARFLRKDVIDSIGGFDENIPTAGEDYALYNKLAQTEFHFAVSDLFERHIGEPGKIKNIILKNFRYGTALHSFGTNQENGTKQFSLFGRKYLIEAFTKSFKYNKSLFLGLMIYIFTVYASNVVGLTYYMITKNKKNVA